MIRTTFVPLMCAALLAGCANPVNRVTANRYYDAALVAEQAGDIDQAAAMYARALNNAQVGFLGPSAQSAAMYGLGRMRGYQCRTAEAEQLLVESLALEEKASGPESGPVSMRLFELARFHADSGRFAQSLPYFARALPLGRKRGIPERDPHAFAQAFDDYAVALARSGQPAEAEAARTEARALRDRRPGGEPSFVPKRYPAFCVPPPAR